MERTAAAARLHHQAVKDLLLTAMGLATGDLAAWFDALERRDAVLGAEVRRMLDAHGRAGSFLDVPDGGASVRVQRSPRAARTR